MQPEPKMEATNSLVGTRGSANPPAAPPTGESSPDENISTSPLPYEAPLCQPLMVAGDPLWLLGGNSWYCASCCGAMFRG